MSEELSDFDNNITTAIFTLTNLALEVEYGNEWYDFDEWLQDLINKWLPQLELINKWPWNRAPKLWRWKSKIYKENLLYFFGDLLTCIDYPHGIRRKRLDDAVGYLSGSINDPLIVSNTEQEQLEWYKRTVLFCKSYKFDIKSHVYTWRS